MSTRITPLTDPGDNRLAPEGSPGDHLLRALGLRPVLTLVHTRLTLAEVDTLELARAVSRRRPATGWSAGPAPCPTNCSTPSSTPAGRWTTCRWARPTTAPCAGTPTASEPWRPPSPNAASTSTPSPRSTRRAARSSASASWWSPADRTGDAQHYGTAVLPEQRGRGLARWMKQLGIQLALDRHPLLNGLLTDTAADNLPIRRINETLGYRRTHGVVQYQLDLG